MAVLISIVTTTLACVWWWSERQGESWMIQSWSWRLDDSDASNLRLRADAGRQVKMGRPRRVEMHGINWQPLKNLSFHAWNGDMRNV